MRQPSGSALALTGSGTADDPDSGSVDLTGIYTGANLSSPGGWSIDGQAMDSVVLFNGSNSVGFTSMGNVNPGSVVTYSGGGVMPIAAGSATLV